MAIRADAAKNHDELFPRQRSELQKTDPELIEIFDNWAFGDVIADSPMDVRTRLLMQLGAIIACHATREYRVMLGAALEVGVTPVEIKEVVYQAVPYLGMARVYDFLDITNQVLVERGVALPLPPQSTTTVETRLDKGMEAQRRLFGDGIDRLYAESPKDQLHIQRYLTAHCFGDHYTRAGLDLAKRELLTFSMLAALGGCEPQLAAHVVANLAVGNDRKTLVATVSQLLPFIGYPRTLNALKMINQGATQ